MGEITLLVTRDVVDFVAQGHPNERQIAIRDPSADIKSAVNDLRASRRRTLVLGGFVRLSAGDTGAIWEAHNKDSQEFALLYGLLSRRPDSEMRFLCLID